jgi:DNA-binding PadR family transcriptional regulator
MFYDINQFLESNPDPRRFWMGRHPGGHGFGRSGRGPFGGFGRGGGDFRTGRKFNAPDLQLIILAMLAEKPSHGYELIKALEERSNGFYTPSPGVIYPALTYLEEIGHATFASEGNKKLYQITETGRNYLAENREAVDSMLKELERIGSRMDRLRQAFQESDFPQDDEGFDGRGSREVHAARRVLKMALHEKHGASGDEAKRIAAILRRAAAEISGNA